MRTPSQGPLLVLLLGLVGVSSALGQEITTPPDLVPPGESQGASVAEEVDAKELVSILLNVVIQQDILYAHDRNPLHQLHLMLPRKKAVSGPVPLIVWIHGGAWMGGDKEDVISKITPLIRTGRYAAATIGYRMSAEARWPAQIHDCKAAIRWLRANADAFGYDPDRIAVIGSSAGGQLAAVLGTSAGNAELEGNLGRYTDHSSEVACVVDLWGPTDFLQMDAHRPEGATLKHAAPGSPEVRLVGGSFEQNMDRVRSANPITHIDGECPPFLIVHGTNDMLVPYHQSVLLQEALEANGNEVALITVTDGEHGLRTEEVDEIILAFLDRHLHGVGDPIPGQTLAAAPTRSRRGIRGTRGASRSPAEGGERGADAGGRSRARGAEQGESTDAKSQARGGGRPGRSRGGDESSETREKDARATKIKLMFTRFDRDKNGGISLREVPRGADYAQEFDEHDKDNDGLLDLEEFEGMYDIAASNRKQRGGGEPSPPADEPKPG